MMNRSRRGLFTIEKELNSALKRGQRKMSRSGVIPASGQGNADRAGNAGRTGRSTLYELEKQTDKKPRRPLVRARTFDHGEPLIGKSYSTSKASNVYNPGVSRDLSRGLLDQGTAYQVESFETEPTPAEKTSISDAVAWCRQGTSDVKVPDPLISTGVRPTSNRTGGQASSQAFDFDRAFAEVVDADDDPLNVAYAENIEDLASGRKKFTPALNTDREERTSSGQWATPKGHEVFDNMGPSLALATTFDLGEHEVEAQFGAIEHALGLDRQRPAATASSAPAPKAPELDSMDILEDMQIMQEQQAEAARTEKDAPAAPAKPTESPTGVSPTADTTEPAEETQPVQPAAPTESGETALPTVPLIAQSDQLSAWAACQASLLAWKHGLPADPVQIAKGAGEWAKYSNLAAKDQSQDMDMEQYGLRVRPREVYSLSQIDDLVRRFGPVIIASGLEDSHPRIVTGFKGSTDDPHRTVSINDPWEEGWTSFKMPNAGSQYTINGDKLVAFINRKESTDAKAPGIIVVHLINETEQQFVNKETTK